MHAYMHACDAAVVVRGSSGGDDSLVGHSAGTQYSGNKRRCV
jgi:hypothetical protein